MTFSNKAVEFVTWARKLENYVASVFADTRNLMSYSAEADEIVIDDMDTQFESVPRTVLEELNSQLYSVLMATTDGDSFDIVTGSGSGEARRLRAIE